MLNRVIITFTPNINKHKPPMILFRVIFESAVFAVGSLVANKLRTLLSLLGVVIGIFVIILILTSVDSLKKDVNDSISSLGDDVVFIHKWPWEGGFDYPWWKYFLRPQPELKEVDDVVKRSQLAEYVSYRTVTNRSVKYRNNNVPSAEINGIWLNYDKVQNVKVGEGRYFTEQEIRGGRNVVILGWEIANGLFNGQNAIGRTIKIDGRNYDVIGVLEKEGESLLGTGDDEKVFMSYNSIRTLVDLNNWRVHKEILVKARPGVINEELKGELTGIMRSVRKLKPKEENDFSLNEASMISKEMSGITIILNIVGGVIGFLAILVGGFGIANIMFVSVKERTNIIGIQKALGAKRIYIVIQFLTEAFILSLIGGFIGLLLVWLTSLGVQSISTFNLVLNLKNVFIGVFIASLTGLVSGIIPAIIASRLDPVEAIRSK